MFSYKKKHNLLFYIRDEVIFAFFVIYKILHTQYYSNFSIGEKKTTQTIVMD